MFYYMTCICYCTSLECTQKWSPSTGSHRFHCIAVNNTTYPTQALIIISEMQSEVLYYKRVEIELLLLLLLSASVY